MNLETESHRIRSRLEAVQRRIVQAAERVGRDPAQVKLVVVTKTHPIDVIRAAVQAGAAYLGENYPDEAVQKMQSLGSLPGVEWHMIGHVQSRKTTLVAEHFACLHSLDRQKIAQRLEAACAQLDKRLPVMLECNTSGEASKFGWPVWDATLWPDLVEEFAAFTQLKSLRICGLMTMAPYAEDPEAARPYFQRLRAFQEYLTIHLPALDWSQLSMGMSGDFEVAIEEGATWVRIGTAILGSRAG